MLNLLQKVFIIFSIEKFTKNNDINSYNILFNEKEDKSLFF